MSDLDEVLASLLQQSKQDIGWTPRLFAAGEEEDQTALRSLVASGEVALACDTLVEQLAELIETRHPSRDLTEVELEKLVEEHLQGTPPAYYGTWVYYPWSRQLAHVLPAQEFREVRTSRNRNKITKEEQDALLQLRIGVVGLSVGQASAVTLAMEEVGGTFFLADFDAMSLSNMNRLRAGVRDIAVNKAVLTARQIFELNPYANIEVITEGLIEDNIPAFLAPNGQPLDLLVEECDDVYIKIRVREGARRLRIPVIMETSDRGMVDIERFDLEPDRPLFHGLIEGMDAKKFKAMSTLDKLPLVLEIIGGPTVSPRMAGSLVEIEETLKTWPQLASGVALGGALNTDAARRIALGEFEESGRFYVDLEQLLANGASVPVEKTIDFRTISKEALAELKLPEVSRAPSRELTDEHVRTIVAYAVMAPSGGNAQPWSFVSRNGALDCYLVPERSTAFLDYHHLASYAGLGAAVENVELVAPQLGFAPRTELFPEGEGSNLVCRIRFDPMDGAAQDTELFEQIRNRVTNRKIGEHVPMDTADSSYLLAAAEARDGQLQLVANEAELAVVADMLGRGDRMRFVSKVMHKDLMEEIRWNPKQVEETRDGLDVATLELSAVDIAGLRLATTMGVMELVGKVGGGRSLEKPSRKAIAASSAVGLVTTPGGRTPRALFQGGRAMQRVWLAATARGYAFQPMTAIVCLFWRLLDGGDGLRDDQKELLAALRAQYLEIFDVQDGDAEIMLFRIARADPPTAHALRRHVDDVLEIV